MTAAIFFLLLLPLLLIAGLMAYYLFDLDDDKAEQERERRIRAEHDAWVQSERLKILMAEYERYRRAEEYARQQQREQRSRAYNHGYSQYRTSNTGVPRVVETSFQILELSVTSTEEDIKKAYRKLSMKHHPDRGGNAEKFVNITKAKDNCIKYVNKR